MRKKKFLATAAVLIVCALAVFAVRSLRPDPAALEKARNAARSKGDSKAPLWITEYFDYQCPPCASARTVLDGALDQYPGKIYLQVRFFPLPAHKNAMKASAFAECASRQSGKFWAFHEELFAHQKDWAEDPYPALKFADYAEKAGLNVKKLDACANDPAVAEVIEAEKKAAMDLGVRQTPTFIVNGKIAVGLKALADELIAYFEKNK
jgi:protein-disulfide isomerase